MRFLRLHVTTGTRIDRSYEQGYQDGGSSAHADWAIALGDFLPDDVDEWSPTAVADYLASLSGAERRG